MQIPFSPNYLVAFIQYFHSISFIQSQSKTLNIKLARALLTSQMWNAFSCKQNATATYEILYWNKWKQKQKYREPFIPHYIYLQKKKNSRQAKLIKFESLSKVFFHLSIIITRKEETATLRIWWRRKMVDIKKEDMSAVWMKNLQEEIDGWMQEKTDPMCFYRYPLNTDTSLWLCCCDIHIPLISQACACCAPTCLI